MNRKTVLIMLGLICMILGVSISLLVHVKMFLFFTMVGIVFFSLGVSETIRDRNTELKGVICYGIVRKIGLANVTINDKPVSFPVTVSVCTEDSLISDFKDNIKDINKYSIGTIVKVKRYKNDINIIDIVPSFELLPIDVQNRLKYLNDIIIR